MGWHDLLGLGGSAIYLVVTGICLFAGLRSAEPTTFSSPNRYWLLVGLFFAALIALRLLQVEESVRELLRQLLQQDDLYTERREIQAPFAILGMVAMFGITVSLIANIRGTRQGRRASLIRKASLGVLAMIGLIGLRLISFHPTDALLYGPLRLNWIIDIGSSLWVGIFAWKYARLHHRDMGRRGTEH